MSKVLFMLDIKKVSQQSEIETITSIAHIVFHEVYDPYTPVEFVDQFIEDHQSVSDIQKQINEEGFHYYLLRENNTITGYLGVQIKDCNMVLSKLYVLKEYRGLKIGKQALAFVNDLAQKHTIKQLELEVSKQNSNTIKMYERDGFEIKDTLISLNTDGTKVEDYVMVKTIPF